MQSALILTITQIFYWLALATWFGGVMFVAMAAPIIFRTVRESDPTLPTVLSVNLEAEHSTLLAGSIVVNLLVSLIRVKGICAAVLAVCLVVQWLLLIHTQLGLLILRTLLLLIAAALWIIDWRVMAPRTFRYRQEYIDHADEPDIANAAKDKFDQYHRAAINVLMAELAALLGLVLFSAGMASTASAF